MKKLALLLFSITLSLLSFSQELLVQSSDKGMYLVHTVAPKENFYSVGRLYAISPKEIAAFNGLDMAHGLHIGQAIQVPLTTANFSQASAAQGRPVYYVVGDKEGLYRVSLKNGKVLMADLRKWNNLHSDAIAAGQKLIVGYLSGAQAAAAPATQPAAPVQTTPVQTTPVHTAPATPAPAQQTPVATTPAATPANNPAPVNPAPRSDSGATKPVQVVPTPVPGSQQPRTAVNDGHGGYFKSQYEQQARSGTSRDASVTSGIFKTASGWQDAKYYLLIDGAEPGTLVKVTNPANGKSIYAKVLGAMSGIRQNQGYDIRISNAAANVLETGTGDKFTVRIQY